MSADQWTYVVTDIETDGPWPGPNSMRAFASVAATIDGTVIDEFEAVLEPLPGSQPDPATMAWWRSMPEWVWEAATEFPLPPAQVMDGWVRWVRRLPGKKVFAASPLSFDGTWMDFYLRRFTNAGLHAGPDEAHPLFPGRALCISSLLAGMTGLEVNDIGARIPLEWLGEREHTNHALDDARGFVNLLAYLHANAGEPRIVLP